MDTVYLENQKGGRFEVPFGLSFLHVTEEMDITFCFPEDTDMALCLKRTGLVLRIADAVGSGNVCVNGDPVPAGGNTLVQDGDQIQLPRRHHAITVRCGSRRDSETAEEISTVLPESHSTPTDTFGFEPDNVGLAWEGIGAKAAKHLSERYRPIQVISSGGMGRIMLVQEVMSGRFVALKVMLESVMYDESLVQQFVREAIITARLQHPYIIPVHDLGFFNGKHLYYTMSYIEGDSFGKMAKNVDLAERLRILRSAALAVNFAHTKGLWHRDLKPSNLLVGPLGDTYVIDWGLVSIQPGKEYRLNIPLIVVERFEYLIPDRLLEETPEAITDTGLGGALGTPAYMAPEQVFCQVGSMGAVSDVWAFGIMLFEALTGKHPLLERAKGEPREILYDIKYRDFPLPSDLVGDVPRELNELCRQMLEKNPENRVKDLGVFILCITKYLQRLGQPVTYFGTPKLPAVIGTNTERPEALDLFPGASSLREENKRLLSEIERSRLKNQILVELLQLNWFEWSRRRKLWSELARL